MLRSHTARLVNKRIISSYLRPSAIACYHQQPITSVINKLDNGNQKLWEHLPGEGGSKNEGVETLLGSLRAENYCHPDPLKTVGHDHFDVAVVGGGIVGLATARELIRRYPTMKVVLLEKEAEVAGQQTGHNSGVIHAGIYYQPGSRMAHTCTRGADLMYAYCEEHNLPVERCGKLVVACNEKEHEQVEKLYRQGTANGVKGLKIIYSKEITELEPNVKAYSALYSPNTGIVNYWLVGQCIANELRKSGRVDIKTSFEAKQFRKSSDQKIVISGGEKYMDGPQLEVTADNVITCGGLYADRLAGLAGGNPHQHKIVTFRGTYYQLKPEYRTLVRHNIYPVPSGGGIPVGVHFTPTVDVRRGHQMIVGPGACITFSREGYRFWDMQLKDIWDNIMNINLWSFALKNLNLSFGEVYRDLNKRAFLKSAQKYVPGLSGDMVEPSFAGVMAQVFESGGKAAADFIVERQVLDGLVMNVRNAPSPACTAGFAIGEMIADCAEEDWQLSKKYKK
ncbi:FAD dependent oxidoreductase [Cokeromyces recurvatus]|uniref:FAD dependent oxidoreductase n=1 Tax=Cokeromyces recurvatus TaxID=90255 RepID=UPI00221F2125|nr:FAD dependent oxidoreductase [Cokeromyces recurvatus]KAI7907832.1 FAD dependent oxidoreductase [Cokeromyces recurvatus]